MLDRSKAPKTNDIDNITLPTPQREVLQNGIPFFVLHNAQLDLIHLCIRLHTGTLHEPEKHVAAFTYALLKESAPRHSANEMADLFDFYGTHYTCSVSLDHTTISISVPKDNLSAILPEIFEFLSQPTFRSENLEIYKNLKIKDLEYNIQKTDVQSTRLMLHAMFGDKYTVGQLSSKDTLSSVTLEQMRQFHARTFCAENLTLYATGNLSPALQVLIRETFERMPRGNVIAPIGTIAMPADPSRLIYEEMPDSVQSSITLCLPLMGYNDADRRDFAFLSTLIGGYFGSRLMQNLREKKGLTYGISCGSSYFGNQSLFIISSDVDANRTQTALDACFEELGRLHNETVPDEEMATVRNWILGDQLRDLDNSVSYLKRYMIWDHFGTDEQEFYRIIEHVKKIQASRVQELAEKHIQYNKITQIVVGRKF